MTIQLPFVLPSAVEALQPESIVNISYGISGDRTVGAHPPLMVESNGIEGVRQDLMFKSAIVLQQPVLDPSLAVGFLPLPSGGLRVGQLVNMKWRVERLKPFQEKEGSQNTVSLRHSDLSYMREM